MTRSIAALVGLSLLVACAICHAEDDQGKVVLFDGHDLSKWQAKGGGEPKWKITEDGAVEVVPHSGDIETKEKFGDCKLHVEFRTPIPAEGDKGQHRGNSGIFLEGQYEIQVLESYGLKPTAGDCGALYSITAPSQNVAKPPMEWQTYDITFHAPKFDADGKKTGKREVDADLERREGAGQYRYSIPNPQSQGGRGSRVRGRSSCRIMGSRCSIAISGLCRASEKRVHRRVRSRGGAISGFRNKLFGKLENKWIAGAPPRTLRLCGEILF